MSVEIPKILIIDDDLMVQSLIEAHLDALELTADTCDNGEEALRIISTTPITLLFLDISLSSMSGIQCCREIRKLEEKSTRKPAVIIALTGNTSDDECREYLQNGFDKVVAKPFNHKDIKSCLALWEQLHTEQMLHYSKAVALESLDGNESLLPTMVSMFLDLMPEIKDDITSGLESGDLKKVVGAAHTLKSRSLLVGAPILNKIALEMEMKGKAEEKENLPKLFEQIKQEFELVRCEFEAEGFIE